MADQRTACTLEIHNRYYEITYHEVSRQAVDDYFYHLDQVLKQASAGETVYILSDGSEISSMQPLQYMMSRARALFSQNRNRPHMRVAVLYQSGAFIELLDGLFRVFMRGHDRLRFFRSETRDDAINWLLSD